MPHQQAGTKQLPLRSKNESIQKGTTKKIKMGNFQYSLQRNYASKAKLVLQNS